ncbi:MAG: T9SS type A sorting domain-containing protein [Bacteroidetes bacterium]|nr:T9SS type A sorting domain-containing protein [Bacteroidota bacterium]
MLQKSASLLLLFLAVSFYAHSQVNKEKEEGAGISARLQQEIDNTKDPAVGYVPMHRLVAAYEQRKARIQQLQASRAPLFTWTERGPNTDAVGPSNGNSRPGNGKTSGRVRAIWEDLGDATGKTVWVGSVSGGLWKTNDITLATPTWTPINDFFGNLAIASICQDPTDVNIMYFGTGEKAINADAVRGAGIWMSTDHGVTWSVMAGTSSFWNVSKMVCDATGNLYVGCNSTSNAAGIQRFTKATSTWTNITPSGLDARVPDIELSSTGRLHIVCGYFNTAAASAGYRYTDNPATVTPATWTSPAVSFTPVNVNVDLASNGNTLYALPSNTSYQVPTIYKSTNGGANWAATTTTPAFTSGQGWYCLAVAVDPNNANNVIVGSLDCYKSTNGGTSWTKISEWVGTTGQYVHADQQIITWRNNNQVLFGSDGGVHYSANGGTTITDKNTGLRIKQFYSVAVHPTSTNYFLAGAQDNGVHQMNSAGLGASVEVTGGDGAFVHIDQDQPQFQWGSYVFNQYRRSTNSGSSWSSVNFSSTAGRFINPTDYDDVNNIMYCSGAQNAFVRWSNPQSGATFTSVSMTGLNTGTVSAVKVSPYTNHTVFFGGGRSTVVPTLIKATNANATPTFTNIIAAGMQIASANISSIELGSSEQNIIVAFSNYGINNVWVTADGGTTWSAIDGNLPDMPVRWAMFYPGSNTKAIIATETGIWQTELINGAATIWDPETGFPNVRTDMLQYRASDGLLTASTHGRGIFTTIIGAAPSCGTVSGLASSAITTSSATISWTALGGALNYDVDYKLASSATWINAATATASTSVNLAGLTQNSLYDWRVRANCTGATGSYTQAQFTTLSSTPTCGTVTGLVSSSITTSGATVSWTALSGALNYDVDYKTNASATWINAATGTASTSVVLSGLSASTLYDWRVRANCTGATGAYAQAQFTTAAVNTCPNALDISTNGTAAGAATIPFNTDVKGLISPTGDNDYYKFVITTGGTATITLTTLPFDYDVRLYSSNGTTQLAISQNGGTTSETISRTYTAGTYYVQVFGFNGANSATLCYTLRVALGTATMPDMPITTVDKIKMDVYPNPARQVLNISMNGYNDSKTIEVYDLNGKKVLAENVSQNNTSLRLNNLVSGIYLLKVSAADGTLLGQQKFIKE